METGKRLELDDRRTTSEAHHQRLWGVEDARRLLLEDKALAVRMIDRAGEENLANREIAAPWAPGISFVLGRHLLHMIRHLDSHKSQLFYYLKLQGKPVDTRDLWG